MSETVSSIRYVIGALDSPHSNVRASISATTGVWTAFNPNLAYTGGNTAVRDIDWSRRGNYVAITHVTQPGGTRTIEVRQANVAANSFSGSNVTITSASVEYSQVKWNPDERYLAVGISDTGLNSGINIYYRANQVDLVLANSIPVTGYVNSIVWNPAGNILIATVGANLTTTTYAVHAYQWTPNNLVRISQPFTANVTAYQYNTPAFSPDGSRLAIAGNTSTLINTSVATPWPTMQVEYDQVVGVDTNDKYIVANLASSSQLPVSAPRSGEGYIIGDRIYYWDGSTWQQILLSGVTLVPKGLDGGTGVGGGGYNLPSYAVGRVEQFLWINNGQGLAAYMRTNENFTLGRAVEIYDFTANTLSFANGQARGDTLSWTRQEFTANLPTNTTGTTRHLRETRDFSTLYMYRDAFTANALNRYLFEATTTSTILQSFNSYDRVIQLGSANLVATASHVTIRGRLGVPPEATDEPYVELGYYEDEGYQVIRFNATANIVARLGVNEGYAEKDYVELGYFTPEGGIPAEKIKGAIVDLPVTATQTAVAERTRENSASITAQVTVAASGGTIKEATAAMSVTSTMAPNANLNLVGASVQTVTVTQSTTANKTTDEFVSLASAFAQITRAAANVRGSADLFSENFASMTAVARRTSEIVMSMNSATAVSGVRTGRGVVNMPVVASTNIEGTVPVIIRSPAHLFSTLTMTVTAFRIVDRSAVLNTRFSLSGLGGVAVEASAATSAQFRVDANGRIIEFDENLRLIVPQETRQYLVLKDIRTLSVAEETRVNTILGEVRSLAVPQETRQETIV